MENDGEDKSEMVWLPKGGAYGTEAIVEMITGMVQGRLEAVVDGDD